MLVVGAVAAMCAACGAVSSSPSSSGRTTLKQAALTYARATLTGGYADLEASLSTECRATDHVTAQNLGAARSFWEKQLGLSFNSIRITGVKFQDVTSTSGQAEVQYNPAAGNNNWVDYVLHGGKWEVGGKCAVPIGNFESSSTSG